MELSEIVKIIETTHVPVGVAPIGTEWIVSQVKTTLIAALSKYHGSQGVAA